ncbi:MAG: hypothetical protein KKB51_17780 [Candidatus Riflebacteria bacterium]|nr:hypothetical protein [Candidatus Riflebacteria bacterium]
MTEPIHQDLNPEPLLAGWKIWRHGRLFLIILPVLVFIWNTFCVSRVVEIVNAEKKTPLRLEAPIFYETGENELSPFCWLAGSKEQMTGFLKKPVLVLLDGVDSRFWSDEGVEFIYATLEVKDGENPRIPAESPDFPGIIASHPVTSEIGITFHLNGPGKPLRGGPGMIGVFLQDLFGKLVFDHAGSAGERRFFLAIDADIFYGKSKTPSDEGGLLSRIERNFQLPAFFLRNALAREKLYANELLAENGWIKSNYIGFPVFISRRLTSDTIDFLKTLCENETRQFPFENFHSEMISKQLTYVFLKEQEHGKNGGFSFTNYLNHPLITSWIEETTSPTEGDSFIDRENLYRTLAHETFHAMQSSWKTGKPPYDNNEGIALSESGAVWFEYFVAGRGKGLELEEKPFSPGSPGLWPPKEKVEKSNTSHYKLYGLLQMLFLRMEKNPEVFLGILLDATLEGSFSGLAKKAGYPDTGTALREFYAFCWWNSLGCPGSLEEPFEPMFSALSRKAFFARNPADRFQEIFKASQEQKYFKYYPRPGHSLFFKGTTDELREGFELIGNIPANNMLLYVAFLGGEKYLSHRRLNGLEEFRELKNQIATGADGWSLWLYHIFPGTDSGTDDLCQATGTEYIVEIFRSVKE